MSEQETWKPLECPECESKRANVITGGIKAQCVDCGSIFKIDTIPDPEAKQPKKQRVAAPGVRHRRDNGPQELEVTPVPPPPADQLGSLHLHTEDIISGGAADLLATHHRASKLAVKFGEELVDQWRLKTDWMLKLAATHRGRERANYAMRWRPTFLAVVALSHSTMLGCRAAKVNPQTVVAHRREDPDFDAQVLAAQDHCIELLHAVTMRSAIEGDTEPAFWQGIQVGHIKKFDNRLRIELLRAHLPSRFKTPGSGQAPLIAGDNNQVMIMTPERQDELIRMRREALEAMRPKPTSERR